MTESVQSVIIDAHAFFDTIWWLYFLVRSYCRAVGDGAAVVVLAAPVFAARMILLAVKDSYTAALSICSSEKRGVPRLKDREAAKHS